MDDIGAIDVD